MGNCSSSRREVAELRQSVIPSKGLLSSPESKKQIGETSSTSSQEREVDVTLPLSPDASLSLQEPRIQPSLDIDLKVTSPISSSSSSEAINNASQLLYIAPIHQTTACGGLPPRSTRQDNSQTQTQSPTLTSHHASPPKSRSHGRAYQARLEKARNVQLALSQSTSLRSIESITSLSSRNSMSVDEDDLAENNTEDRHPPIPLKYSMSSANNTVHSRDNDEFENSLSSGMVWAEFSTTGKVSAVALSRRKATLDRSHPPLFLAVGTDDGGVTVCEILEDSPLTASPSKQDDDNSKRRLGKRFTLSLTGRVRSLDFSTCGHYLAIGGDDCQCTIVNLVYEIVSHEEDEKLVDLEVIAESPRVDRVYAVQFSPDSKYIAIGGYDGTVAIVTKQEWITCRTPEPLAEIQRDGLVFTVDWSPDGKLLAIGGSDKCCALVDVETSWNVFREIRRSGTVQSVKWFPKKGHLLAIGSTDVCILDRNTWTIKHEIDLGTRSAKDKPRHTSTSRSTYRVNSICWSPMGSYCVLCGSDNKCIMLETKTYTTVQEIRRSDAITSSVWGQQSVISGSPRSYLVVGGEDMKIAILKAGLELHQCSSSIGDDVSSSMGSMFSHKSDWTLKEHVFKDVDDFTEYSTARQQHDEVFVTAIAFSRGSKTRPSTFFAYAMSDGLVVVRSTTDWKAVVEIRFSSVVTSLAFSNGSRFLALGTASSKVYVTETAPSWSIIIKREFNSPVNCLSFSKHNERLAVGTESGVLSLLNPEDNYDAVTEIDVSASAINVIDWSTRNFVVGREDGTATIYDSSQVCSNFCVPIIDIVHKNAVRALSFGVSSRFLAIGEGDGRVSIYNSKSNWSICHQLQGPPGLETLAWNSSGRFLALGGSAGAFQMVDTMFWTNVHEVEALMGSKQCESEHQQLLLVTSCIAFSQDGNMVALNGTNDGTSVIDTSRWKVCFSPCPKNEADGEVSSMSSREEGGPIATSLGL